MIAKAKTKAAAQLKVARMRMAWIHENFQADNEYARGMRMAAWYIEHDMRSTAIAHTRKARAAK